MRATRAYIASAGTAVVMLGASLAMLVVVSAFVAFGSWPGADSGRKLDQVVVRDVVKPETKKIAVRSDAVQIARRAAARRQLALERQRSQALARTPAGTPVAQLPTGTGTPGGATVPPTAVTGGGTPAVAPPAPQVRDVTQNVEETTRNVTQGVQQGATEVQTQVNEIVDAVVGGTQQTATGVTDTASGLLGGG